MVKQNALLADLNALDEARKLKTPEDKIDVLAEASPTLPLWRRVDRQYWWNEWISKPFINAGVRMYSRHGHLGAYMCDSSTLTCSRSCKVSIKSPLLLYRKTLPIKTPAIS